MSPAPGPMGSGAPISRPALAWREIVRLVPASTAVVPQYAVRTAQGWAMTQGQDSGSGSNATDNLILTRFTPSGLRVETRRVLRGGHGDRADVLDGQLRVQIKGVWARVTFGSPWSWHGVSAPARCQLRGLPGLQGEARLSDGRWVRLYGESMKGGSERDPSHRSAFLQVIQGTTVQRTISLDKVARDSKGAPIGGRYEPEGVSLGTVDGVRTVLVGFAVGRLGSTTMRVYGCPEAAF